eukprot:4621693-Amphidinium_carterae.1
MLEAHWARETLGCAALALLARKRIRGSGRTITSVLKERPSHLDLSAVSTLPVTPGHKFSLGIQPGVWEPWVQKE